ncbi:winged helix-turn-helix domain-containing protein, partial [Pseudomaricurvus sp.]|uniref:winged helix-turn-helix domain-containing protein n=1 Tax=Pseudomaricurvus sp. TaxID=2004510 RepID=UPI003F6CEF42
NQLHLDRTTRQVTYNQQRLAFTPLQFRLLWVLVENRHEILSKPYLYQTVMEKAYSRYDRGLDMHLSRVRRKLVEAGMDPERLATVHGQGYRFD